MKAVIQRVRKASVEVEGNAVGEIGPGLLVLLGVAESDESADLDFLVKKVAAMRIFPDEAGKMNRSVQDAGGAILVVSQFTLIADTAKGNRPSFIGAARPEKAIPYYESFVEKMRAAGITVATGIFGADMQVSLVNDGPVTIVLDSKGAS